MSNEWSVGTEQMLLLSIKVQATLGRVKDARARGYFLEDYGQYAPLYELVGSDRPCICTSDWNVRRQDTTLSPGARAIAHIPRFVSSGKGASRPSKQRVTRVHHFTRNSSGKDTTLEECRCRLAQIYMQHAPQQVAKIPNLLAEYEDNKESLDMAASAVTWKHVRLAPR